jgi:hypothetical protein
MNNMPEEKYHIRISVYLKGKHEDSEHLTFNNDFMNDVESITGVRLHKYFKVKKVNLQLATLPNVTDKVALHTVDISKEKKIYIPEASKLTSYYVTHNNFISENELKTITGTLRYYVLATERRDISIELVKLEGRSINTSHFLHWQPYYSHFGYNDTTHISGQVNSKDAAFRDWINDMSTSYVEDLAKSLEEKGDDVGEATNSI